MNDITRTSNEKASVLEIVHRADDPIGPWTLQLLRDGDLEPWVILRSTRPFEIRHAHEPRDAPVAYRKLHDSPYESHPRYLYRDDAVDGWEPLYAQSAPPPVPGPGMHPNCTDPCPICDREDAERWRALRNCARITAMGSAGCQPGGESFAGPTAHVTLNFWTHNEREQESWHREWLDTFVCKALRVTSTKEVKP